MNGGGGRLPIDPLPFTIFFIKRVDVKVSRENSKGLKVYLSPSTHNKGESDIDMRTISHLESIPLY